MYNYVMLMGKVKKIYDTFVVNQEATHIVVSCARPFKNADGKFEYDDIDVVTYNAVADAVKEFLVEGDVVVVKGRLHISNYDTLCYVIGERFMTAPEKGGE